MAHATYTNTKNNKNKQIAVILRTVPFTDLEIGEFVVVERLYTDYYICDWLNNNSIRCNWTLISGDFEIISNL